ncbi:nucleotide sugar dehydrogenase [Staphylococcus nepalensis]|uniref:Nucleotide sugar dehydrogenase n=1 Tax=Staphylococcus nepalensis TaxID=214473 RepID=A0ABS3L131_9STAP|nr:nucleotide sugar dehydrogenase [Staphylococcus nepalensis]MBO1214461.1 nucleotide sugar dehydrogenase [Staphylococcus nepalensis]MBO1216243.1 nucleotide sugar dehydrogenase [Staphylococcus nepalensis]MBO1226750.1 nucleotide sugar dehydrogenase [Staphylococcus nepalensis]MBO1233390.1 nucleotide sugar dehydrogenase [Staphylococcus nepalensis]MBO1238752.1 nucleotide sugar dehydrogenase [Staphylococcus nepalensis]
MKTNKKIAVIGLGYVGMPLAVTFAKNFDVIGFDIDKNKISSYQKNIDPTGEIGEEGLKDTTVKFTSNVDDLKEANFYIITVPTPIKQDNTPNLAPIESATTMVAEHMNKGDYIVYESTVYPGVTEDICVPLIEKISGLASPNDFKVGYSPERINPGDKKNTVENIVKIVSGIDDEALEEIASVYGRVIKVGTHKASSIKVAESAKVVENSQRDINIAFMNELSQVFNLMGINTFEVIEAMNTKWNSLGFYPGLVGGHCIGVDPYYFIYQAENLGYHSQIISAGRKINNQMSQFIINNVIKELMKYNKSSNSNVVIAGLTFKENTPDFRNSKVMNMISELNEFGIRPKIIDPYVKSYKGELEADIIGFEDIEEPIDVLLYAVNHKEFRETEDAKFINLLNNDRAIIVDLKNRFKQYESDVIKYWSI